MAFKATKATYKVAALSKKIRAIQGGTSASKTISILLYLIDKAQTDKVKTLTSIVSESTPHLKRGAIRDFKNIMQAHGYWRDSRWNATDSIYTFETGSQIEFFGADQSDKLRGARRDRCFINEANNVSLDAFDQLEVRTREFIFLDWNPTNEFWFYTDVKGHRDDVDHIVLTYKDNEALDQATVDAIEARKGRKGWWKVYGEGQLGEVEGKIYKDWAFIDEIPHEARLERYGLDFGYSNDPTSIVAIYRYNGGYILDEIAYKKGLLNKDIADIILNNDTAIVVADSAEPKSIDEIGREGISIVPAQKGKDSVTNGIQLVQGQRITVTNRSVNIIREYRNYLWMTDRDGKILNKPEHEYSHCFAPETIIKTTKGDFRIDELVGKEGFLISSQGKIKRFYDVKPTRLNTEVISIHTDNDVLTVTPDHLIMKPDGTWIQAQLLCPSDMIQSVTYDKDLQWSEVYKILWRELLQRIQRWKEMVSSQIYLVFGEWRDTERLSYSSQGWKQGEQRYIKPRIETQSSSLKRTYDGGKTSEAKRVDRKDKTTGKQMALIKRGNRVAQVAWQEDLGRKETFFKRMCSLPYEIRNACQSFKRQVLWEQLQNEGETKEIKRITRGFRPITYNLEVEDTHCLLANGVIAHNSMDAIRYGLSSMIEHLPEHLKIRQQSQFDRNFRRQSLNSTR